MSKIYEALIKADDEKDERSLPRAEAPRPTSLHGRLARDERSVPEEATSNHIHEEQRSSTKSILTTESVYGAFDEKLVTFSDPRSASAEQVRRIRTTLSQQRMANGCKSIMVTSAIPEEGKTLIACNVGVAITQGLDDEAFLIDCDLRKPGVHQLFGVNSKPGLAEFLTDKEDFTKVVREVPGLKLKVIPAGRAPEGPAELLSSDKMAHFLQELKAKYKDGYIILDTPPILIAAEVGALAHIVDGIILIVQADKTPRDVVKRALKEITKNKIIGIVANCVQSKGGYYSSHYSKYHHGNSRRPPS